MGTAVTRGYSTNCAWCYTPTNGAFYCSRCERLACEFCGFVYSDTHGWACEWCRDTSVAPRYEEVAA